ncbi:Protein BOI2 [Cytospora mali]|uniref:Protein BOI2 n=1 Tax=Cytospora mali TaxID=578113 RepID=A0A194VDC0_CYTMA|nr:Protein BOI2 [Valsa mali var. pyri (nom. inval.)]
MATPAHRPEVGDILLVIHDFIARSSDELTLAKGDRVELLERDDEFGDGWFLGKHLVNGNSGLFPEVYTRPAPRGADVPAPQIATKPAQSLAPPDGLTTPTQAKSPQPPVTSIEPADSASPPPPIQKAPTNSGTLPLSSYSAPASATVPTRSPPISSGIGTFSRLMNPGQDIHVLHETLNVIDEHIDDLRSPPSNGGGSRHANDSGSEYSSHIDNRLSYIAGEETDEEEEGAHSRAEVESWTPDDVAEYLFTSGVEKHHCEVFRDQEISGEVLLGMDQTSLFIKAFDLGSVGRRLKTWQKVKNLQDEVNGQGIASRPTTQNYGSEAGSEGARRTRSRNNTVTGSLSRLPPIDDRPLSQQKRRSIASTPKLEPALMPGSPVSPRATLDSPSRANHEKRPSAASVRDLHYSRRHSSSTDFRLPGTTLDNAPSPKLMTSGTFPLQDTAHKKQPSFDRNWTLGSAAATNRLSGFGFLSPEPDLQDSAVDLDRGYFSSAEGGPKARNVLKKRDSLVSHSHNPSYTDEQRVRSATAMARQSRGGSIGSIRLDQMSPAAQKYYGVAPATGDRRRTLSTNTIDSLRPVVPSKDMPPTVTKLDSGSLDSLQPPSSPVSSTHRLAMANDLLQKPLKVSGLRAISDAVTGQERAKLAPALDSPLRDSPMESPARTGSSTPSAGVSFELDSPDTTKSPGALATMGSRTSAKKKGKKETSAYTRGLLKIPPREAMIDADYSGWMKKKSNSLMTTWKPRLFVLKGRRLAYYYSEDDEQEKGLIDISFHRVLPADNERLTGLHATLTGASNTPTMPANSNVLTTAATDADADTTSASDSIFIFKLVPPRAGLSRAVNFTKPTVHYFAVPNIKQGRFWMAALMKATIDRDDTQPIVTSYQQKTISLAKARQMHHRPPALMNLDEKMEAAEKERQEANKNSNGGGLGIYNGSREDSAVAGLEKLGLSQGESLSGKRGLLFADNGEVSPANAPQSA